MLKKTLLLGLTVLSLANNCQAAVSDAGTGEFNKKEKELYQEKVVPSQDNVINKAQPKTEKHQQDDIKVTVNQIITNPSEVLTPEELRAILVKYEGQELKLKDLYQAVAAVNELYKTKGYITAKAILPPQKIEDGVVKIQLVEGRFGDFSFEGNQHTKSSYIKERISLHSGELVKLDQLQKDIFYFNGTNDVAMKAELKPGKKTGTTDCILRLQEPEEWQTTLFTDNAGRNESGRYRIGMVLVNNSLFGNRESLVLNPTWTKGTMAGSVSYTIPVDNLGTRVGISYSKNQTNIISGPYQSMDISGKSSDVGLSITQPLTVEATRRVEGYGELHFKDSSTDFSGNTLLNSKVQTATLGTNITTTDPKGGWSSQYSLTSILADKQDAYNSRNFWRFNLSVVRQQVLANDRSLIWRLSGQITDKSDLPSSEKFSLGGMSSVKGFSEGRRDGEQGYYIGVEYDFPLQFSKKIKGLIFLDHGNTYTVPDTGVRTKDYLTSTGIGLIFNYSPNVFGKVVVGFPLNSSIERDTTRVHFFLQTSIK